MELAPLYQKLTLSFFYDEPDGLLLFQFTDRLLYLYTLFFFILKIRVAPTLEGV